MKPAKRTFLGVMQPTPSTLRKYGLSLVDWRRLVRVCGGACSICREKPKHSRLVIDHEHVRGWQKMPSERRRLYVRGLCCVTCNHFVLTRYGTPDKFRAAAEYLEDYETRRPG